MVTPNQNIDTKLDQRLTEMEDRIIGHLGNMEDRIILVMDEKIDEFAAMTARGFLEVYDRFEHVEERLDRADEQFIQIDQRFLEINDQFANVHLQFVAVRSDIAQARNDIRILDDRLTTVQIT